MQYDSVRRKRVSLPSQGDYVIVQGILARYIGKSEIVDIPQGITRIGGGAFASCGTLVSVTIPEGVTRIDKEAFVRCYELRRVIIPSSVTSIGDDAFKLCTNLRSVKVPISVTKIGRQAFDSNSRFRATLYGMKGSYTEEYAREEHLHFVAE